MREISLRNVKKTFGGVHALSGVDLTIRSGRILALVGENGAGKSTLMKILSGVIPAGDFEGEITIDGEKIAFSSPRAAEAAGVAIIHQELSAFPSLSVAENLFVGHWPRRGGLVDFDAMATGARALLDRVGAADLDPMALMNQLSTGAQQLVEIAKALGRESSVLILDEPTSSLTPGESAALFKVLRALRAEGKALVYISHKMEEIFALADEVAVLRDGRSVHQGPASEVDEAKLVSVMVGRPLDRLFPEKPPTLRTDVPPVFVAKEIRVTCEGKKSLGPLSFELRKGEILGFAGLLGAGRTELFQAMLGGAPAGSVTTGTIEVANETLRARNPGHALDHGLAIVGEDRKRDSILPQRSLQENSSISRLSLGSWLKPISPAFETAISTTSLDRLRTRRRDLEQPISDLSGGNQQKVVLARVLQAAPDVLVLDEPTRGVDVGAKFEIYQILFGLAAEGQSLIVISSDLPELMALCDRIAVIADGRLTAVLERPSFSQEAILSAALKRHSREAHV
ncbi:MAG: sugar ABC transporter ATP-binding protein [Bdellovibrionota bacterium]